MENYSADLDELIERRRDSIIAFTRELVKFDTSPPGIDEPTKDGGACQQLISQRLKELGLSVESWEPEPERLRKYPQPLESSRLNVSYKNRPVVVGRLAGESDDGKSLILNGHMDVVPARYLERWKHHPFGADLENGKIYGRGSTDMKGGIASMIEALSAVIEIGADLRGNVIVELVPDEETAGMGTISCVDCGYTADAALLPEPTRLAICSTMRGILWGKIVIQGRPAHAELGQSHWLEGGGVNAITKATSLLDALRSLSNEWVKRPDKTHSFLSTPEIVPTIIRGGEFEAVIPEKCEIVFNSSYLWKNRDSEGKGGTTKREIEEYVRDWAKTDPWLRLYPPELEWIADFYPAEIEESHPLVTELSQACSKHGIEPRIGRFDSVDDAAYLSKIGGIPCVTFGPGNLDLAHGIDEYVSVDEIITATKIIASLIGCWCS